MKNLYYTKPGRRVFTEEDQVNLGISSPRSEPLVWDPVVNAGVLEVSEEASDRILEVYPSDFKVLTKKAPRSQMSLDDIDDSIESSD